jgi:hypothetical protein
MPKRALLLSSQSLIMMTSILLLVIKMALTSSALAQNEQPTVVPTVQLQGPSAPGLLGTPTFLPSLSGVGGTAGDIGVSIRSGPGLDYRVIGVLRPGRSIDITGTNGFDAARTCSPNFEADLDMWVEVRFRETVGWMARCALEIRGDLSKLPTEAPPPPTFTPTPFSYPGAVG